MTRVKFTGRLIDSYTLVADDLKKVGIQGFTKTEFKHGVPVEVTEEVATALTEEELFGGQFELVDDGASTLDIDEPQEDPKEAPQGEPTSSVVNSAPAGTAPSTKGTGATKGRASTN